MACNRYCVVSLGSPCTRAMGGGFIHIVRAFRAESRAHAVSCTEDAMVERSQVREELFEITPRYRSFVSNHAPHVCEMQRSNRGLAKAATRGKPLSPAGHMREYSCVLPTRSSSAPEAGHKRMSVAFAPGADIATMQQQIYLNTSTVANGSADHGRKRFSVNFVFCPDWTSTRR